MAKFKAGDTVYFKGAAGDHVDEAHRELRGRPAVVLRLLSERPGGALYRVAFDEPEQREVDVAESELWKPNKRERGLLPNGVPRKIRVYDNGGESTDRYTVVFTGRIPGKEPRWQFYLAMSENPFHPQGVGMHGENFGPIDYPKYSHLGRKIGFRDLPADCRELVLDDYCYYWDVRHPMTGRIPEA